MLRQRLFELEQGEANNAGGTNNGGLPRGSSVNHDILSWKETMPEELTISENWTPEWVWDTGPKMYADETTEINPLANIRTDKEELRLDEQISKYKFQHEGQPNNEGESEIPENPEGGEEV